MPSGTVPIASSVAVPDVPVQKAAAKNQFAEKDELAPKRIKVSRCANEVCPHADAFESRFRRGGDAAAPSDDTHGHDPCQDVPEMEEVD
mmetsp:Transcript_91271/g.284441  ORF Transcript_91271/g.284441 Transcript_91271/m.284441 type:complete len:89 (+) Transcript_91271:206-472(+)